MEATISFSDIVKDREATVRITDDKMIYAVDLVMVVTGKDRNQAGYVIRNIPDEIFQSMKIIDRQLSTRGGHKTKLISFQNAIELIMVLPGKIAKETRTKFADIIHRYMAGDASLAEEIEHNTANDSPIHQLARETLPLEMDPVTKKRRIDLETRQMEAELVSVENTNRRTRFKIECEIIDKYASLCSNNITIDERARAIFKESLLNMVMVQASAAPIPALPVIPKPISISTVASELGYKPTAAELIKIGVEVKNLFVARHNRIPPKHEQLLDGRVTQVNSYTEADRDILEDVLRRQLAQQGA